MLGAGLTGDELKLRVEAQVDVPDGLADEDELRLTARRQDGEPAASRVGGYVLDRVKPKRDLNGPEVRALRDQRDAIGCRALQQPHLGLLEPPLDLLLL